METDDDYDVAADYLDRAKLVAYAEVMAKGADKVPGVSAPKPRRGRGTHLVRTTRR